MPEVYMQNSRMKWFLVYHLPTVAYAAAIILISSIPNLKTPEVKLLFFDKLAHFVEYAVFAFLAFRSFSHINDRITKGRAFLFSALFLSLFALLDEFHQHFVPGRNSDVYDLIGDILGALMVLTYLLIRSPKVKKSGART